MPFKSKTTGIITGPLEAYCLVCISYLRSEWELTAHIEKPTHKKNLESAPYHEQYKDQSIRKVMAGYYCEFCNMVLPTSALVDPHVTKTEHVYNRNIQTLRRVKNGVLAFKNVFISEKAWNGIKDKTCSVCSIELRDLYVDPGIHMIEHIHTVNLLMTKIEFYGESLYRTCPDASHCLTCNKIFSFEEGMSHFETADHKRKYDECVKEGADILSKGNAKNIDKKIDEDIHKAGPSNSVVNRQNNTKPLDNVKCLNENNYIELEEKEICKAFGAKSYISDDRDPENARCIVCDFAKKVLFIHLKQRHHFEMIRMHKARLQKMGKENGHVFAHDGKDATNTEENENKRKILESTSEFQKDEINIDFITCTALCKKCSRSLKFEFSSIVYHIEEHKTKQKMEAKQGCNDGNSSKIVMEKAKVADWSKLQSSKTSTNAAAPKEKSSYSEEIQAYMTENNLQERNDKVFCTVCDVCLPGALRNWEEHINGFRHKLRTQQPDNANRRIAPRKVSLCDYIESILIVGNNSEDYVLLNNSYCLTGMGFMMYSIDNNRIYFCYMCLKHFNATNLEQHSNSHKSKFDNLKVITSLDNEFVREAQPDVYHCGYCNTTETGWDALQNHLNGEGHREAKANGLKQLQFYRQKVIQEVQINHAVARLFRFLR